MRKIIGFIATDNMRSDLVVLLIIAHKFAVSSHYGEIMLSAQNSVLYHLVQ